MAFLNFFASFVNFFLVATWLPAGYNGSASGPRDNTTTTSVDLKLMPAALSNQSQ